MESCGILAGILDEKQGAFFICTLIIPKQVSPVIALGPTRNCVRGVAEDRLHSQPVQGGSARHVVHSLHHCIACNIAAKVHLRSR